MFLFRLQDFQPQRLSISEEVFVNALSVSWQKFSVVTQTESVYHMGMSACVVFLDDGNNNNNGKVAPNHYYYYEKYCNYSS